LSKRHLFHCLTIWNLWGLTIAVAFPMEATIRGCGWRFQGSTRSDWAVSALVVQLGRKGLGLILIIVLGAVGLIVGLIISRPTDIIVFLYFLKIIKISIFLVTFIESWRGSKPISLCGSGFLNLSIFQLLFVIIVLKGDSLLVEAIRIAH
jgi:hypothetical protein